MKKEIEGFVKELKENSFRVFAVDGATTWIKFEKNNNLGYCEYNPITGFNFSTVHKPNTTTGTGFSIHREISNPTIQHAVDCFVFAPDWASQRDRQSVEKYKDIEEYIKKDSVLQYKEI